MDPIDITPEDSVAPVYLIELTAEELAEREQMAAEEIARIENQKQAEIDRQNAIDSATAKLAKIGLTIEEIQAVIGIN